MAKGGTAERDTCWELSRWWTGNRKELVFWRTSNSGGGATVRFRKGISNKSHAGDITAIEETGLPFTRLVTLEIKRGYSEKKGKSKRTANLHDLIDGTKQRSLYEDWINQASTAATRAGSRYWMLLHKRDHRRAMVFFPSQLYAELSILSCFNKVHPPFVAATVMVRTTDGKKPVSFVGLAWQRFLGLVDPDDVRQLVSGRS